MRSRVFCNFYKIHAERFCNKYSIKPNYGEGTLLYVEFFKPNDVVWGKRVLTRCPNKACAPYFVEYGHPLTYHNEQFNYIIIFFIRNERIPEWQYINSVLSDFPLKNYAVFRLDQKPFLVKNIEVNHLRPWIELRVTFYQPIFPADYYKRFFPPVYSISFYEKTN